MKLKTKIYLSFLGFLLLGLIILLIIGLYQTNQTPNKIGKVTNHPQLDSTKQQEFD
nr:hypothetical protein [Aster yellows witches'-broom phytoplasma]